MSTSGLWAMGREELNQCRQEIERENRSAFRLLSVGGLFVSVFNYLTQLVVAGEALQLFQSGLLAAYFALLIFIDRALLPEDRPLSTKGMYVVQAIPMLLAVLLGTVWDPNHQATTILMMMLFMPAFLMDSLPRFAIIQALWSALFILLSVLLKPTTLWQTDLVHVLEFYVASCVLMVVVSSVRLQSLRRQMQMHYHMTHDRLTGCQNWSALEARGAEYLGSRLLMVMGVPDRMKAVNDVYGDAIANAAGALFIHTMMDLFGADNAYVKSGKDLLCIVRDVEEEDCLNRLKQCRRVMHGFEHGGKRIPMTCAFGYVTAMPEDALAFDEMIRLSEIYLHQAESTGNDQTKGSVYTPATFRAAAGESNNTAAQSYEISSLTGLPRLYYFTARVSELLGNVVDVSRHPVVGFIRLTRLREYNDTLGYAQGDALIKETANQLRRAFYSRVLCHVTAGQFCVLCYREEAEPAMRELCDALKTFENVAWADCKAGFAEYTGSEQVITLIDRARLAQKSIQAYRDQRLCFYDAALDAEQHFRQYIISHLDEAVEKDWLITYYQPIMRAATGRVCSEEALSRWKDPEYGLLMPYQFIPPLEENGLMYKMNLHVVDQVLANFRQRQADGMPLVPVSVNLSRKDFAQCDMVQEITDRVDASGFPRSLICIEITESAFTSDQELLRRVIKRFRENGFPVWLDDFGSEYSTLNLLEEIDFDLIKMDMKFMHNFTGEGKNFVIVSHTLTMARKLGMVTLMEGVENEAQYHFMQKLDCDMVQGYLFNKPNPYDYIIQRFRNGTGLPFENVPVSERATGRGERS